jgi:NTE family protein
MKRSSVALLLVLLLTLPLSAKTALVLSGGGARGLAHIAILEAIEEQGIEIDLIVGTSMGALIGGLYSVGYTPAEIRTIIKETDLLGLFVQSPLFSPSSEGRAFSTPKEHTFSLGFTKSGGIGDVPALIGDQRILELLSYHFAKIPNTIDFDRLPIPFRCISTDIVAAEAVVHDSGSLIRAIRSSIAIPIVFSPFPGADGRLLLDGGLVDNFPVVVARSLGADFVIASDVNAELLDDLPQLESLSTIAMQTVVLATHANTRRQYDDADLVFEVKLKEFTALDFTSWEQIIAVGEQSAAQKHDELIALADHIQEERSPFDPLRMGMYAQIPDPVIRSITLTDLSTVPSKRHLSIELFDRFIDRTLDYKTHRELTLLLREMRTAKGLSSLTYEMGDAGELIILARGFGQSTAEVTMGFTVDTGFSNRLPASISWFRSDAFLDASVDEALNTPLTLRLHASLGAFNGMDLGFIYPFSFPEWGAIDINVNLGYGVGALSPLSAMTNASRTAPLDRMISAAVGVGVNFYEYGWARLEGGYDLVFLHDERWHPSFVSSGWLEGSLLYNTLTSTFSPRGIRFDLLSGIGLSTKLDWSVRAAYQQRIALSTMDSLGWDVEYSLLRLPRPLVSSYVDLGSRSGIPGYSPLTLHRDVAIAGVTYQRRLFELLGYPSYLKTILRGGVFDSYDPYTLSPNPPRKSFASPDWDLGLALTLALDAPIGEVFLSFGIALSQSMTFAIGIY